MNEIQKKIQAILFWKNEPMTVKEISKMVGTDTDAVRAEVKNLQQALADSGIILMLDEDEMRLATSPDTSEMIESFEKTELSKELSKAALETLAIILYKGPIRRSEIDYIRGVNSQFIVRHMEIRGLIEKEQSSSDARIYLYKATLDLLSYMGLQQRADLPEFDTLNKKLEEVAEITHEIEEVQDK